VTKPWNGNRCTECGNPTIIQVGPTWYCIDHVQPALALIRATIDATWHAQFTNHHDDEDHERIRGF
jgi:hypothetical protein